MSDAKQSVHAHPVFVVFKAEALIQIVSENSAGPRPVEEARANIIVLDKYQFTRVSWPMDLCGPGRNLIARAEVRIAQGSALLVD